ncbi:MAG: efflux RND transporter periplasmic adaptor subunit [Cyanobacteria bacterium J06648_16]
MAFSYERIQANRFTQETGSAERLVPTPTIGAVSALGRLEPQGEITLLSAPNSLDGTTTRIDQLLVSEGDRVQAGQVVAILDSHDRRQTALQQSQAAVEIAEAELNRVKAGARMGDIDAQKASIARLEAELSNAQLEYDRFDALFSVGAISESERDSKRLVVTTTQAQLAQARSDLDSISEVRPVDIDVAEAELSSAIATVTQAEAELNVTYIRAPQPGQVIEVYTKPGEVVDNDGILAIGQTEQMVVVAEVYETDIGQVQVGQDVIVTSAATNEPLQGVVSQIGLQVDRQEAFNTDPTVNTDNRIVEVSIQLDEPSSEQVRNLSNLQVQVVIRV